MQPVAWGEIEAALPSLHSTKGGYSKTHRGIITLPSGAKVFAKLGIDEDTKAWTRKEIASYQFLSGRSYPYVPELLSESPDGTGLALSALCAEDGWDWSSAWSRERAVATFSALDALAEIIPEADDEALVRPAITDADDGWSKLAASEESRGRLMLKLAAVHETGLMDDVQAHARKSVGFHVRHDALVHYDVRADNCAWNRPSGEVKLVDWNWFERGDRRIDRSSLLVHIENSGYSVLPEFEAILDEGALHWLAGFWLERAGKPIWPPARGELREFQLRAGLTALKLEKQLRGE